MVINIMAIDATFWVAVSFVIFFGGLIYLKVPHKINDILNKLNISLNLRPQNLNFETYYKIAEEYEKLRS